MAQQMGFGSVRLNWWPSTLGARFRLSVLRNPPVTPVRALWMKSPCTRDTRCLQEYNYFLLEYNGEAWQLRLLPESLTTLSCCEASEPFPGIDIWVRHLRLAAACWQTWQTPSEAFMNTTIIPTTTAASRSDYQTPNEASFCCDHQ